MEGLPRTPQSGERRVVSRAEQPTYRQPEESRPPAEYSQPIAPRSGGSRRPSSQGTASKKRLVWALSIAALLVVICFVGWLVFKNIKDQATGINPSRYQAVFLANGQIYFGKLENFNDTSFKISTVYYPQTQADEDGQTTSVQASSVQIIKLGDEVHGPENELFIYKDQILYYENLKEDSQVAKLIEQNEAK